MAVGSDDVGESLVESGFPGPVPGVVGVVGYPGIPVVVDTLLIDVSWGQRCVCILSTAVCTASGIPRLKDRHVDSWVVIVWAYSCWRDGGGFVIASLSLTFGVADLCGCLDFGGFRAVGHNDRGGIPPPRRCVGGLLHGCKRLLPPKL
ncbi:hypothetical protein NDU88_005155 [Pleurodeles waltl]|uniref:Uncharacterized protein n=1 Tax=Pleurodeles waltl TaxID=8319 RepID=A0AAV7UK65_PLEWA|nr:hypothetical protein NDU88_005155 [Pleurodeles waltl]